MSDDLHNFESKDERLWFFRAKVMRVVDGDTVYLYADKGFHEYMIMKVRLAGIDAPELRPRSGTPAQRIAEKVLATQATQRLEDLIGGKEVIVRTEKAGKFGRWLGEIYLPSDATKTANQTLLEEGLAVKYGDPRPWRDE